MFYKTRCIGGVHVNLWSSNGINWFSIPLAVKTTEPMLVTEERRGPTRTARYGSGTLGVAGRLVSRGGRHKKILKHTEGSTMAKKYKDIHLAQEHHDAALVQQRMYPPSSRDNADFNLHPEAQDVNKATFVSIATRYDGQRVFIGHAAE